MAVLTSMVKSAPKNEVIDRINVVRLGGIRSLWLRTFAYYMRHCRGQFDVVITEGFGGSRIPRLAPLYVKEPIITEWHQVHDALFAAQYPRLMVPFLNAFERITALVHRNTLVVARTVGWQAAFSRIGFRPANIFVVPAAIEENWLEDGLTGTVSQPRVVWLGKFRRYKCPHHAVTAMQRVVREVPGARLILAGRHDDLHYEAQLQAMVKNLKLSDNVEFRFNLSEGQKRDLLRSSRVMVVPSSVEGFGVVVLEANACGVPVVASSGVPTEAVAHGMNGLRYDFGNVDALSDQLVKVLTNDHLYRQLSLGSVEFAKGFAFESVFSRYEAVIRLAVQRATTAE